MIDSIDEMKEFLLKLKNSHKLGMQLFKINTSVRTGISYYMHEISLKPEGKIAESLHDIVTYYANEKGVLSKKYVRIQEYDGANIGNLIYCLSTDNPLIKDQYAKFEEGISITDVESKIKSKKYDGYVILGKTADENEDFRLISIHNPISTYECKHRFMESDGAFKELKGDVLQIRTYVDAIIYKGYFYMMSLNPEKLFDLERSYRTVCSSCIDEIKKMDLLTDTDMFSHTAMEGHNPHKFISFNRHNLELLSKDADIRKRIANVFEIPVTKEGKIDTKDPQNSDKLIRILCNKGMLEPFEQKPMEVEGARNWQ